jgi:thiamine-monophosphate kinase
LRGEFSSLSDSDKSHLIKAYRLPDPRDDAADVLLTNAHASMDVSDGLVADALHMAMASQLRMVIELDHVPTSPAARAAIALGANPVDLVTGGDDYQALCTASEAGAKALTRVGFQVIGHCEAGASDIILHSNGREIEVETKGFVHA